MKSNNLKLTDVIEDPDGMVVKLIFEGNGLITETVAYKYKNRGVVCFSVQSGCRIGCKFCGTGNKFLGNLSEDDMHIQINEGLKIIGLKEKIQIMSMSMGEPMDNWWEVLPVAKQYLNLGLDFYVSTVGLKDREDIYESFNMLGKVYNKFGLQFSLHYHDEEKRQKIMGQSGELLPIKELKKRARSWKYHSGKPVYFNYMCNGSEDLFDAKQVADICRGMHVTCSVVCNTGGFVKTDNGPAIRFSNLIYLGTNVHDVSVFDPAGQDTIGGGCGQLLYVQKKMKELNK